VWIYKTLIRASTEEDLFQALADFLNENRIEVWEVMEYRNSSLCIIYKDPA